RGRARHRRLVRSPDGGRLRARRGALRGRGGVLRPQADPQPCGALLDAALRRRAATRGPLAAGRRAHVRVPALDLRAQYAGIRSELRAAVDRVFERQSFVLGEEVEALERELSSYCEARHAIACGSGSDALLLSLQALGVGPGDEVLCPAFTFFATAGS